MVYTIAGMQRPIQQTAKTTIQLVAVRETGAFPAPRSLQYGSAMMSGGFRRPSSPICRETPVSRPAMRLIT